MRQAHYEPRPLAIDYSGPLLKTSATYAFSASIRQSIRIPCKRYTTGINPRVAVTDLLDSSAFEIWAVPPSRLTLIPGLKASEAAFERLVHYIFDAFREGRIAKYQ